MGAWVELAYIVAQDSRRARRASRNGYGSVDVLVYYYPARLSSMVIDS